MCDTKNYNNLFAAVLGIFFGLAVFLVLFFVGLILAPVTVAVVIFIAALFIALLALLGTAVYISGRQHCIFTRGLFGYTCKVLALVAFSFFVNILVLLSLNVLLTIAAALASFIIALAGFFFATAIIAFILWIITIVRILNRNCMCDN